MFCKTQEEDFAEEGLEKSLVFDQSSSLYLRSAFASAPFHVSSM